MAALALALLGLSLALALVDWHTLPVMRCRKVGGLWFLRLHRLQLSFCVCRN